MPRIKTRPNRLGKVSYQGIRAFTLLESLLVLATISSLVLLLSSQVGPVFSQVRSQLFFLEFEHFYRESQQLSQVRGQELVLTFSADNISNGFTAVQLPPDVEGPRDLELHLDKFGGNHSLARLDFRTDSKTVSYQLFLGSGKYKKTEN